LEIKLLQRRSKCLEENNELEGAKDDLERAQFLDNKNPAVKDMLAKINAKLNTVKFAEYRETANQFLKEKKFQ
jgi:hypothetical protein